MIPYPNISPDIIKFGGLAIRWYSVMYLLGYVIGFKIFKNRREHGLFRVSQAGLDNFITYLVVGMLLGARIFYIIFYNLDFYLSNPSELIMIWHGGLSFHGALVGMVTAAWLFAKKYKVGFFEVTDAMAMAAGPGLFLGRMGNFINGELYGRPTTVPWAMIFAFGPGAPSSSSIAALPRFDRGAFTLAHSQFVTKLFAQEKCLPVRNSGAEFFNRLRNL